MLRSVISRANGSAQTDELRTNLAWIDDRLQGGVVAPQGEASRLDRVGGTQQEEGAQGHRAVEAVIHPLLVQAAFADALFQGREGLPG